MSNFQPAPTQDPIYPDIKQPMKQTWILWFQQIVQKMVWVKSTATTAGAGGGITLPAKAQGYITVNLNGVDVKIPYYPNT